MSYISVHLHVVFATKNRMPWIERDWRSSLFRYMGGSVRGLGAYPQEIGGIEDHVHALIGIKATHQIADLLREVKKATSVWVHKEVGFAPFVWQEGYGAFSVSPTARNSVKRYIANQEEHHKTKSSLDEFVEMLEASGIPFDRKYLD